MKSPTYHMKNSVQNITIYTSINKNDISKDINKINEKNTANINTSHIYQIKNDENNNNIYNNVEHIKSLCESYKNYDNDHLLYYKKHSHSKEDIHNYPIFNNAKTSQLENSNNDFLNIMNNNIKNNISEMESSKKKKKSNLLITNEIEDKLSNIQINHTNKINENNTIQYGQKTKGNKIGNHKTNIKEKLNDLIENIHLKNNKIENMNNMDDMNDMDNMNNMDDMDNTDNMNNRGNMNNRDNINNRDNMNNRRARGYYSFFGLCRHQARSLIQKMFFPGFVKASW
ncbi:hypothetical protein PFNF135_03654 [Plasmodium falciparum NF135/5.C10]|uniref:Uncharacterized protein n=1 Tax=Plasmodium falciparum NF135/5.C10 TaxID=1036726 RepID=W4IES8_PLAFA|nr:hypothetical protein PFNF135_03654 [Plasmodium falciparum NF135/5.C10]